MSSRILAVLLSLAAPLTAAAQRLELEADALKPGLVAEYRSLVEESAGLWRNDAKPAFCLGRSSPHPRLPAGPFEVTWTGVIQIREDGPLKFSAVAGGAVTVLVDGVRVVDARGTNDQTLLPTKMTFSREP